MSRPVPATFVRFWPIGLIVSIAGCGSVEIAPDASGPDTPPIIDAALPDASLPDGTLPDAYSPDASPSTYYEIAYVNEMTFDGSSGAIDIAGFVVVVNTGESAIDLSTTQVLSFSDDSATVGYTFSLAGDTTTVLQPDEAAGELSPLAVQRIISSGLVSEPLVDTSYSFQMSFSNIPPEKLDVQAQAVLKIGGENITLPFTIHFVPDAGTAFFATRIKLTN